MCMDFKPSVSVKMFYVYAVSLLDHEGHFFGCFMKCVVLQACCN